MNFFYAGNVKYKNSYPLPLLVTTSLSNSNASTRILSVLHIRILPARVPFYAEWKLMTAAPGL